jgi:hypothetical protein
MNLNSNTTYGGAGAQPNTTNLSATIKALQEKIQKDTGVNFGTAVDNQFQQPISFNQYQAPSAGNQRNISKGYIEPGTPMAPQDPGKTQPLPIDYSPWDMTNAYGDTITTTPTSPILKNWPLTLGGGQYVQDTANPNEIVKTQRTIMDDVINPGRRKAVLGDLSPALYQVDHILPLWAGGADTLTNLEALNNIEHEKKTAVQSVALTLLRNKKITESEAKAMAFSWADYKDQTNLPTADEMDKGGGTIPLAQAQKIVDQWKNPSMWKYFGDSFKENMAGFSSPKMLANLGNTIKSIFGGKQTSTAGLSNEGIPVIGEFAKGLAGATGLAPGSETTPESGVVGKVSNFAGNLVTMMTGIGLLSKAASGVGIMGRAAKLASSPVLKYDGIGLGFGKVKKIADSVAETVGLVRKVAKGTEAVGNIAMLGHMKSMAQGAGLLGVWGQLTQTGRNLTGQEEATIKGHMKQFFSDAAFGGVTAGFGQSIKGYAGIGLSTTALSLMLAGDNANIQDALKEGATMSALHLLGLSNTKFKAGGAATVYGGQLEQIARDQALKQAAVTLNQGSRSMPFIAEGEAIPGVYKADMVKANTDRVAIENETGLKIPEITTTEAAIKMHADVARIDVDAKKADNLITEEQWNAERLRIAVAEDTFKIRALPLEQQGPANQKYLNAIYEKAKAEQEADTTKKSFFSKKPNAYVIRSKSLLPQIPTEIYRTAPKSAKILEGVDFKLLNQPIKYNGEFGDLIVGDIPVTGIGKIAGKGNFINPTSVETINDFQLAREGKNDKKFLQKGIITNDQQDYALSSRLAQDGVIDTPGRGLRMWLIEIVDGKPVIRDAGMVPKMECFDIKDNSLNNPFQKALSRLKAGIIKATSPEQNMAVLNEDRQARLRVNIDQATRSFEAVKANPNISNEELYSIIKTPGDNLPQKYNSASNNVSIGDQMEKMGSNITVVDIKQAYRVDAPKEERPRYDPTNPYLDITLTEQGALQGAAMSKNGVLPKSPMDGISETMKGILGKIFKMETPKVTPQQVSASAGVLKKMSETPIATTNSPTLDTITPSKVEAPAPAPEPVPTLTPTEIKALRKQGFNDQMIERIRNSGGVKKTVYEPNNKPFGGTSVLQDEAKKSYDYSNYAEVVAPTTPVEAPITPVEAPKPLEASNTPTEPKEVMKKTISEVFNIPIEKREAAPNPKKDVSSLNAPNTKIAKEISLTDEPVKKTAETNKVNSAIREFYNDMEARLEYAKFHPVSAAEDEKSLMRIIKGFTRKNPGLPDAEFRDAMGVAKQEARNFARSMIDDQYKGTYEFGEIPSPTKENVYKRTESEKLNVLERRYKQLSNREKPLFDETTGEEDLFSGIPLKSFEKTELNDVKIKLDKYKELEKQTEGINQKAYDENRPLTEGEKKELFKLEKQRFSLSRDYQRNQDMVLADKFDLKLTPPDKNGNINIALDKDWNPMFSDEYLASHPNQKSSPIDTYGKILSNELDVRGKEKRVTTARFALDLQKATKGVREVTIDKKGIKETKEVPVKKEMVPYTTAQAKTILTVLKSKYGDNWWKGWSVNAGVNRVIKGGFSQTTPEGMGVSASFGSIAAKTRAKNPLWAEIGVRKANEVTKAKTDKMAKDKIDFAGGKDPSSNSNDLLSPEEEILVKEIGSNKNILDEKDVLKDLTPLEKQTYNALLNTEARAKFIEDYNQLRKEMKNPTPTKIEKDGTVIPGTKDTMADLFTKIKAMSIHNPEEVSTWKLGDAIHLKNNGAPTAEQGVKDGFNIAMKIIGATKKKIPGTIKYEKIRDMILGVDNPVVSESKAINGVKSKYPQLTGKGGPDGKGGLLGNVWNGIKDTLSNTTYYNADDPYNTTSISRPGQPKTPAPAGTAYNVRGIQVKDPDLTEASHILYGEISNNPNTQKEEVRTAMNTAINRALQDQGRYGGSIVKVLQAPAQYQSYAPNGIKVNGKVIESQYQKLKRGAINETDKQKLATITGVMNEMKSGSFPDTTGGKTFYVHATDGTMFVGKTQDEAKKAANAHEKVINAKKSSWKKTMGFPV